MLEENKVYNISDFVSALREGQEFDAKKGPKVDSENKKNNSEAVDDILKKTAEYDGGISEKAQKKEDPRDTDDYNKTTLDADFDFEPNEKYKEDTEARVKGFASAANMKNSKVKEENKGVDFEGNEKFYKTRAEISKKLGDRREAEKAAGLKAREINKDIPGIFKDKTLYKENKAMKRLHFGKTVFLNENDMLKRIPDDMKVDGNKFYMKDAQGNEYLIECKSDEVIKEYVHTNIVSYNNKQKLDESFEHMKHLYNYKSSDSKTTVNETKNVSKMLAETKMFTKKNEPSKQEKFFNTLLENVEK